MNLQRDILEVDRRKDLNQNLHMRTKRMEDIQILLNPSHLRNLEIVDRGLMGLETANIPTKIEKILLSTILV